MKLCACGQPAYRKGRVQDTLCRECRSRKANEWNKKNKDKYRANELRRKFGITLEEYKRMEQAQNGVCAICREPEKEDQVLSVDHDHETKTVRGLLCGNCNRGIGNLKDSPLVVHSAFEYLTKHKSYASPQR